MLGTELLHAAAESSVKVGCVGEASTIIGAIEELNPNGWCDSNSLALHSVHLLMDAIAGSRCASIMTFAANQTRRIRSRTGASTLRFDLLPSKLPRT